MENTIFTLKQKLFINVLLFKLFLHIKKYHRVIFQMVNNNQNLNAKFVHYSAIFVKNKNIQVGKKLIEFFYTKLIINSFHQQMKQLRSSLLDI